MFSYCNHPMGSIIHNKKNSYVEYYFNNILLLNINVQNTLHYLKFRGIHNNNTFIN